MNDRDTARDRAIEVELGRVLSAQSGPEWQGKVRDAQRAAHALVDRRIANPPVVARPTESQWGLAVEALTTLVSEAFGTGQTPSELLRIHTDLSDDHRAALTTVTAFIESDMAETSARDRFDTQ